MAWTQADLTALKKAYASGVLTVRHGDNVVTYQSMSDMERAINRIERSLSGGSRIHYPAYSRE